jgi:hypothetical protein
MRGKGARPLLCGVVVVCACGPGVSVDEGSCPELVFEGTLRPESLEELMALPKYTAFEPGLDVEWGLPTTGGIVLTQLEGLNDLTEVPVFECLESAGSVGIQFTDLRSLRGMERLREVGRIWIERNDDLESLEGLSSLVRVETTIKIGANANLRTLGMRALEEVFVLEIGEALPNELDPTRCSRSGNPSLVEIDGLDSLRGFQKIAIRGNESLASVDVMGAIAARAYQVRPEEGYDNIHDRSYPSSGSRR